MRLRRFLRATAPPRQPSHSPAARYLHPMRKLPAWFRSHPIIPILLALAALFTGAHFFLNWQAERRWQAYVKEGRARGVKFDLTEFAPPKIPDAENFAALPMMRAIMQPGAKSPMALPEKDRPNFGNTLKGERLDWEKWQTFFKDAGFISETTDSAPRDVLRALEHYAPQFQEWSEWKTRPRCRFDLDFKAGAAMSLVHLTIFQNAANLFTLRMRAHLALGESAAAYADFTEGFQAYRALVEEPTLVSGMVRISVIAILLNGIGDGLSGHAWNEAELRKLDVDFATVRVWEDYGLSIASERGFANWLHETSIAASGQNRLQVLRGLGGAGTPPSPEAAALMACIPTRVYRDSQLRLNKYFDELLAAVSIEGSSYNPNQPTPSGPENLSRFDNFYLFLFRASAPVYGSMTGRYALFQTKVDQARLAFAIERSRIARGTLPEQLDELAPDFIVAIPADIYSGKALIYRRKESGGFILYGVGPNRVDDGGATGGKGSEQSQPDWVWPHH